MRRRIKQINHAIRRELGDLLSRRVNDPRIQGVISVTEVEVSADLAQAKVFVSCLGTEEEKAEVYKGLLAATGYLRREVGGRLRLRFIPELIFLPDNSIERGGHILQLIDQVSQESGSEE